MTSKDKKQLGVIAMGLVFLAILLTSNFHKAPRPGPPEEAAKQPKEAAKPALQAAAQGPSKGVEPRDEDLFAKQSMILKAPWGRDPFHGPKAKEPGMLSKLGLKGISVLDRGGALAVIGEQIVGEGDWVDDYIVKRIDPTQVVLERQGREFILRLEEEER